MRNKDACPWDEPHLSQRQTGKNGEVTVKKGPVCPMDNLNLSQGQVAFVPGTGLLCQGRRPAANVYVYLDFSCTDNVRSRKGSELLWS